jgi:hypothetical protein
MLPEFRHNKPSGLGVLVSLAAPSPRILTGMIFFHRSSDQLQNACIEAHDAELPRANAFFTASFWPI